MSIRGKTQYAGHSDVTKYACDLTNLHMTWFFPKKCTPTNYGNSPVCIPSHLPSDQLFHTLSPSLPRSLSVTHTLSLTHAHSYTPALPLHDSPMSFSGKYLSLSLFLFLDLFIPFSLWLALFLSRTLNRCCMVHIPDDYDIFLCINIGLQHTVIELLAAYSLPNIFQIKVTPGSGENKGTVGRPKIN